MNPGDKRDKVVPAQAETKSYAGRLQKPRVKTSDKEAKVVPAQAGTQFISVVAG